MMAPCPLAFVSLIGWAIYLGGALSMELLWRPAQEHLPPGQVNLVCQRMGQRYRWIAATALVLVGGSAVAELVRHGSLPPSAGYRATFAAVTVGYLVLAAILTTLTIWAHPALHQRNPDSRRDADHRRRVRRAIRRMDVLLRVDIAVAAVAVLFYVSLPFGGLG